MSRRRREVWSGVTWEVRCARAPRGWLCQRVQGHTGPCGAVPVGLNRVRWWLRDMLER